MFGALDQFLVQAKENQLRYRFCQYMLVQNKKSNTLLVGRVNVLLTEFNKIKIQAWSW